MLTQKMAECLCSGGKTGDPAQHPLPLLPGTHTYTLSPRGWVRSCAGSQIESVPCLGAQSGVKWSNWQMAEVASGKEWGSRQELTASVGRCCPQEGDKFMEKAILLLLGGERWCWLEAGYEFASLIGDSCRAVRPEVVLSLL